MAGLDVQGWASSVPMRILITSKIRLRRNRREEGNLQGIRLAGEALGIRHITIQLEVSESGCAENHHIEATQLSRT